MFVADGLYQDRPIEQRLHGRSKLTLRGLCLQFTMPFKPRVVIVSDLSFMWGAPT